MHTLILLRSLVSVNETKKNRVVPNFIRSAHSTINSKKHGSFYIWAQNKYVAKYTLGKYEYIIYIVEKFGTGSLLDIGLCKSVVKF